MVEPTDSSRHLVLLGPQPDYATLRRTLNRLELHGRLGLITAGWEESEGEDEALRQALPNEVHNLRLFRRTEFLFADDPPVIQMLQRRQDELRHLRDVYRMRVAGLLDSIEQIGNAPTDLIDFTPETESAMQMLRQLDREYFLRTCQVCDQYDVEIGFDERPSVLAHRHELKEELNTIDALLIAGGHSAVILNRLKIFSILEFRPELPLIAWSGGAMALAGQIVFFHDRLPEGDTNPEVLRAGAGMAGDVLPFPDAANRLRLDDRERMKVLARRFDGWRCVLLDSDDWIERKEGSWTAGDATRWLSRDGIPERISPWAS